MGGDSSQPRIVFVTGASFVLPAVRPAPTRSRTAKFSRDCPIVALLLSRSDWTEALHPSPLPPRHIPEQNPLSILPNVVTAYHSMRFIDKENNETTEGAIDQTYSSTSFPFISFLG